MLAGKAWVHDETRAAIEDEARKVEGSRDVEAIDVDVPMLVRSDELVESGYFARDVGEHSAIFGLVNGVHLTPKLF